MSVERFSSERFSSTHTAFLFASKRAIPNGLHVQIPSSIAEAIVLPDDRKASAVKCALAVALYREERPSFGKARKLASLSPHAFAQLLGERGIERHYGEAELDEDLAYAHGKTHP